MNIDAKTADLKSQDDDYWIERMSTDTAAFEIIYDRYLPKISRYIYRKVGDQLATEEITALVFFHAVEGIMKGKYPPRNKFAAWLFSIARAKIADHFRKRRTVSIDDIPEQVTNPAIGEHVAFENRKLEKGFSRLTQAEQELLALRFSADLDFNTIAHILHKSAAAVKMATYRALNKLRKSMEGIE